MNTFIPLLNEFWDKWLKQFRGSSPQFVGASENYQSIGAHQHIGLILPRALDNEDLTEEESYRMSEHIAYFYPFLTALSANSPQQETISSRLAYGDMANKVNKDPVKKFVGGDHHDEINRSREHSTVEVRRFDSNYPQVSLTISYILRALAKGSLDKVKPIIPFGSESKMAEEIANASSEGFGKIDPNIYLDALERNYGKQLMEISQEEGGSIPASVEEILYLASKRYSLCDLTCALSIPDSEVSKDEKSGDIGSKEKMWYYGRQMTSDAGVLFAHLIRLGYKIPSQLMGRYTFSTERLMASIQNYVPTIEDPNSLDTVRFTEFLLSEGDIDRAISKLMKGGLDKHKAETRVKEVVAIQKLPTFKEIKSKVKDLPVGHLVQAVRGMRPDLEKQLPIETCFLGLTNPICVNFVRSSMERYSTHPLKDELTPEKILSDKKTFLIGYEPKQGQLMGYVCFAKNQHILRDVVVLPKYRQRYVGIQLVEEAFNHMRKTSADPVTSAVFLADVPFMEKLGFKEIEKKEDKIVMRRSVEKPLIGSKIYY
jgi:hypothetical protein